MEPNPSPGEPGVAGSAAAESVRDARSACRHGAAADNELANLRADLDDLISRIPSLSALDLEDAKEKLMVKIASAKAAAKGIAAEACQQFDQGIACSRDYVKEHPLQSVGYAAAAGFLLGLLIARR